MNKLIGTYKNLSENFILKIEASPTNQESYIFKKIDLEDNEYFLFEKFLALGESGNLVYWGNEIQINHDTDFEQISIIDAPNMEIIGDYQRL